MRNRTSRLTWMGTLLGLGAVSISATWVGRSEHGSARAERLEIVDRAIRYHGGELYTYSVTRLELCSASGCFEIMARLAGGLYEYDVKGEVRGVKRRVRVTNDSVEVWQDDSPVAVDPGRERTYRDWVMARVYFCFLPYRLNDESVYKEDLGVEVWGGRTLHKVKVTFAPGSSTAADDEYLYWFDPESGRLEQFAYSFSGDPGGLRFRRAVHYRRVGGILFFDQENWGMEGCGLSVDAIDLELLPALRRVSTVELRNIRVQSIDE